VNKLTLPATVTVKELAERLSVSGSQLITYLMGNGVMATLNQSVDFDTAALAADQGDRQHAKLTAGLQPGQDAGAVAVGGDTQCDVGRLGQEANLMGEDARHAVSGGDAGDGGDI